MHKALRSLESDQTEPISCEVTGTIPAWLKGSLYRNGPGVFKHGSDTYRHLFDGNSVLHRYSFSDGGVQYQSRILASDAYNRNKAAQRIVVSEFGTVEYPDPCKSLFARYFSFFFKTGMTDNTAVSVLAMEDQLYAMTETCFLHKFDPKTLESVEKVDWNKIVAVNQATAHPMTDYDGCVYNLGLTYGRESVYNVIKTAPPSKDDPNPIEKSEILGKIVAQRGHKPSYYHSFGMTENYVVVVEQPACLNIFYLLIGKLPGWSFQDCLQFEPNRKTRFHLMNKKTGIVHPVKYESDALFTFHHINAYEDEGHVVVDICGYDNMDIVHQLDMVNVWCDPETPEYKGLSNSNFRRYVFPLVVDKDSASDCNLVTLTSCTAEAKLMSDGSVYSTPQCYDAVFELPRIHYEKFNGRPYQFMYGVDWRHGHNKLVKLDVRTGEEQSYSSEGFVFGEPVFVPNPDGTDEDDGVVLSPMMADEPNCSCGIVILDAKSFTELARGMSPPDVQLSISFHGVFTPSL